MDSKLTLKLEKQVIDKAKEYAKSHNRSLSRIIEAYLKSLVDRSENRTEDEIQISPFVESLKSGVKVPNDLEEKSAYTNYLQEKYK